MKKLTLLIPTYKRTEALALELCSLIGQTFQDFDIVISDQSPEGTLESDHSLQTVLRILRSHDHTITIKSNLPHRGMAQQRHFLLEHANTQYCLYLDDDLILEPYSIELMMKTIEKEKCGFVGMAVIGLSYKDDRRLDQQKIEYWNGPVQPETVIPHSQEWERFKLHNAANMWHVQTDNNLTPENSRTYKVAWVGGCTLYDTQKLKDIGGFSFWTQLPEKHCGEDVLAQLRVMKKYGGCGILPSGVYHQELPTTVPDRKVNAPEVLEI